MRFSFSFFVFIFCFRFSLFPEFFVFVSLFRFSFFLIFRSFHFHFRFSPSPFCFSFPISIFSVFRLSFSSVFISVFSFWVKANLRSERGSTSESSRASFHIDSISQLPSLNSRAFQDVLSAGKKKNWCLTLLRIGNFLTFPGVAKNVRLFPGVNAAGADDPLL